MNDLLLDLLKQFGGVTILTSACTEWITLGLAGAWKRVLAVAYSLFFTMAAWFLGAITLPKELLEDPTGWHLYYVLAAAAVGSTAMSLGGHALWEAVAPTKKQKAKRLMRENGS